MIKLYDFEQLQEKRGYITYIKGTKTPLRSPSWISKPLTKYIFDNIPVHILDEAKNRGKEVGESIAIYEENAGEKTCHPDYEQYFNAYLKWRNLPENKNLTFLKSEYHVVDLGLKTHGFIDLVFEGQDENLYLVEIKTKNDLQIENYHYWQAYIYLHAMLAQEQYQNRKLWSKLILLNKEGNFKEHVVCKELSKPEMEKKVQNELRALMLIRKMLGKTKV